MTDKHELSAEVVYAHGAGRGQLAFTADGSKLLSVGSDKRLCIYNVKGVSSGEEDKPIASLDFKDSLGALAYSATSKTAYVCCDDRYVSAVPVVEGPVVSFGDSEVVLRMTAKPSTVALSPTGDQCAASGEEGDISIVLLKDKTSVSKLRGQRPTSVHLEYDPMGKYLLSASTSGGIRLWDLGANKEVHKVETKGDFGEAGRWQPSWHPDGEFVALPGGSTITVLERSTWKTAYFIGDNDEHAPAIVLTAWSPNGLYIASVNADNKLIVWDTTTHSEVSSLVVEEGVQDIAWCPTGNLISFFTTDGEIGVCDNVVPSNMVVPIKQNIDAADSTGVKPLTGKATNTPVDGKENPPAPMKRTTKQVIDEDDDDDDDGDDDDAGIFDATMKAQLGNNDSSDDDGFDYGDSNKLAEKNMHPPRVDDLEETNDATVPDVLYAPETTLQPTFQPGETPRNQKRRFLAWNLCGSIISRNEETFNAIEVEFSNASKRGQKFTDHYGFRIAALNEHGAVFASTLSEEDLYDEHTKNRSVVYFMPFQSWAHNAELTINLPSSEGATAVALGSDWFSVTTSKNYLRVFCHGGLQCFPVLVPGKVVGMAGYGNLCAVVYHASAPFSPTQGSEQVLGFILFEINANTQQTFQTSTLVPKEIASGQLPLTSAPFSQSPGGECNELQWLGFSGDGALMMFDTNGVLFTLSPVDLKQWIPVLETAPLRKSKKELHWPVGVSTSRFHYVLCKGLTREDRVPRTRPKPLLGVIDFNIPVVNVRGATAGTEQEFLQLSLAYSNNRAKEVLGLVCAQQDENSLLKSETELDKLVLKLMYTAAKEGLVVRVFDLSRRLRNLASFDTAIKICRNYRHESLSEKIYYLKEERRLEEERCLKEQSRVESVDAALPALEMTKVESNHSAEKANLPQSDSELDSQSPPIRKNALFGLGESKTVKSKRSLGQIGAEKGATDNAAKKPKTAGKGTNPFAKKSIASPQKESKGVFQNLKKFKSPTDTVVRKLNRSTTFSKDARTKTHIKSKHIFP